MCTSTWCKFRLSHPSAESKLQAYIPELQADIPEPQAYIPEPQAYTPELQAYIPERQAYIPELQADIPELQAYQNSKLTYTCDTVSWWPMCSFVLQRVDVNINSRLT